MSESVTGNPSSAGSESSAPALPRATTNAGAPSAHAAGTHTAAAHLPARGETQAPDAPNTAARNPAAVPAPPVYPKAPPPPAAGAAGAPGVSAAPGAAGSTPASAFLGRSSRRWRWLVDQIGAILLSFALAVVIWLIAVSQANPLITQDFGERIPITVRGLDQQLQPVLDLGAEDVRVNVRATRAAWEDLGAGDFNATVDLSRYGAGTHDVPVDVTVNDPRITVLGVSPPSLRIQLDPIATRVLSVTVQIMDAPAFGYDSLAPIVVPPTITVSGPATQVELVNELVAPVFLLSAKSQVERTVDVRPINRQNQVVSGVDLSHQYATVVVPVEQWPGRKEVAVRLNLVGQPAAGYRLSTVRAEPSTVVLQGVAEVLATVPGYIETEPLSIEGATSEMRTRLGLLAPPGVTVFDGSTVLAVVSITPIEGGTTVRVQPIVQGLSPFYIANVSPDTVDVILSGPVPLLESLNPDDMFVILDLTGLLPGTHVVTPRVVLPDGIRQEGVLPETVEVVIISTAPPVEAPADAPTSAPAGAPPAGPEGSPAETPTPAAAAPAVTLPPVLPPELPPVPSPIPSPIPSPTPSPTPSTAPSSGTTN